MIKIGLDAGHGLRTAGKQTPTGIKEWTLNDIVRDKVVYYLKGYNVSFVFTDNDEGNTDESLGSRVKKYIDAGVDVFVSIHHNALSGKWNKATGTEVFVDRNCTAEDMKLAEAIYKNLPDYTGLKGRGIKKENWYVINQNKIPAVLCEGGFMDSEIDYPIITSEKGQDGYARAIAEGLIEYLGLKKTTQVNTQATTQATNEQQTSDKVVTKPAGKIDVKYQVYVNSKWLEDVVNYGDGADGYAGIYGETISGLRANTVGKVEDVGKLIYRVHTLNGEWHDEVVDREKDINGDNYAGILGRAIDGVMIRSTKRKARYRVHLINGSWLPWVDGYNINDEINGYAGNLGHAIDGIQIQIV